MCNQKLAIIFRKQVTYRCGGLEFPDRHALVLLCIARAPSARLRDIAASLGSTERRDHGIVTDLAEARYVITQQDGRKLPVGQEHPDVAGEGAQL